MATSESLTLAEKPPAGGASADDHDGQTTTSNADQIASCKTDTTSAAVSAKAEFYTIPVSCSSVVGRESHSPIAEPGSHGHSDHHHQQHQQHHHHQRQRHHQQDTVFPTVTPDMTVQDLVGVVLARCSLKGSEPSAFCIVAEWVENKGGKGSNKRSGVLETRVLDDLENVLDKTSLGASNTHRLSIRQKRGKVVEVYDGRKWPVVRCGSVYVTSDDSAQKVTQTVVTATSVAEKKRRAGKYTVAVGTSHGHVQAFLEDADSVLAALDQCQAEEKCLMLIKRPKESARKMLKSHSWANLSVSDPQLYRQFNGVQLSQVHHPAPVYKGRRSSDEHSVTSNDTDRSDSRRRYVSNRSGGNKENLKQHQQQQQHQQHQQQSPHQAAGSSSSGNAKPHDFYRSNGSTSSVASSSSSDYQYVSRRDRERERRGDLRYSSIPEDATEINNNNLSDKAVDSNGNHHQHQHHHHNNNNSHNTSSSSMYHSCHDVSFSSQASTSTSWSGRPEPPQHQHHPHPHQGQGQRSQSHGRPGHGQIPSDQLYGAPGQGQGQHLQHQPQAALHDPGDMEEGARSQSLGNLSTGLTLSLVGQRKADSMLDLTSPSSPSRHGSHHPHPHQQQQQQPYQHQQHQQPPRTHAPRPRRSEGGGGYQDKVRAMDGCVRSPRHSFPDSVRSPPGRGGGGDEVFSPSRDSNRYYNGVQSPPHNQHHPNPASKHPSNNNYPQPPPSYASGQRGSHPQSNGYSSYGNHHHHQHHHQHHNSSSGSSTSREQTPQGDILQGPPKPKRSLPHVPVNETSERIKRFTEMMKPSAEKHGATDEQNRSSRSRMSASSSSPGRSTATSTMSQTSTTPLSRQASVTDNGSDCEVSSLFHDARLTDGGYSSSPQKRTTETSTSTTTNSNSSGAPPPPPVHVNPAHDARGRDVGGEGRGKNSATSQPEVTSQACCGDSMSESMHSGFTSHSHSSTMDSGYTTNTECDADFSQHHHHHQHYHQKQEQQQQQLHRHQSPHHHHPPNSHPSQHNQHHHNPPPPSSNAQPNHASANPNSHPGYPTFSHPLSKQPQQQAQPYSNGATSQSNNQYPGHHHQQLHQQMSSSMIETSTPRQAPVPIPRNHSLAGARKFSSMQNVSSGQQLSSYQSSAQPDWGPGGADGRTHQPAGKGPAPPVRAMHPAANGAEYPVAAEHQRRSWDLAHNFKSLDFMPLADGRGGAGGTGGKVVVVGGGGDDLVVKPQAVSVNCVVRQQGGSGGGGGTDRSCSSPGSSDSQKRREPLESGPTRPRVVEARGGSGAGGWQDRRPPPPQDNSQHPHPAAPPVSHQPPPPSHPASVEANASTALPGHWKYNNSNAVNNNNGSTPNTHHSINSTTASPTATTAVKPTNTSGDSGSGGEAAANSPPPVSLFQLSQGYDLASVRLTLPGSLTPASLLTLRPLQITLPALSLDPGSAVHSPQGRCARLGGPGSAFRSVRTGGGGGGGVGGGGQLVKVGMTAVGSVDKQCHQMCSLGELRPGDVLVEVNGRQCLGWDLPSIQRTLDTAQGEVMLGIARAKHDAIDNRVQQLESSLQKLEVEVKRLNDELAKKDSRILELSTMLPWKADEGSAGGKVVLESEDGAFVIGDNEFVV